MDFCEALNDSPKKEVTFKISGKGTEIAIELGKQEPIERYRGPPSCGFRARDGPFHDLRAAFYFSRKNATLRFCQRSSKSLSGTN